MSNVHDLHEILLEHDEEKLCKDCIIGSIDNCGDCAYEFSINKNEIEVWRSKWNDGK